MRILVLGGRGFIGARLASALDERGHAVSTPAVEFAERTRARDWQSLLEGIEVVVNAVGIFRERASRSFELVHEVAPRALFLACEAAGVRRVIQLSALGADAGARSRFHRSKKRADDFLAARSLDWAIVQPSLVFGAGGASARLFAMLAALPLIPLPGEGLQRVQPIHIDDLTALLVRLVESSRELRAVVPAVGPHELSLRELLAALRRAMGLSPARFLRLPLRLVPLDRETLGMLERGNTASAQAACAILGRLPRPIEGFVDERDALRARLDWLLPLLRAAIALVWVAGGVASLFYPLEESLALLARVGLFGPAATVVLYGAALLDILLGVAIYAVRRRRWLWRAQFAVIAGYSVIIALRLPELWLHPFGPLVKNLPLLAAIVLAHELEER